MKPYFDAVLTVRFRATDPERESAGRESARLVGEIYCARVRGLCIRRGQWTAPEDGVVEIRFATLEEKEDLETKLNLRGEAAVFDAGTELPPLDPDWKGPGGRGAPPASWDGPALTSGDIQEARRSYDGGTPALDLLLNGPGAARMLKMAPSLNGRALALTLDGRTVAAAAFRQGGPVSRLRFAGCRSDNEHRLLAEIINAGPVPGFIVVEGCELREASAADGGPAR